MTATEDKIITVRSSGKNSLMIIPVIKGISNLTNGLTVLCDNKGGNQLIVFSLRWY